MNSGKYGLPKRAETYRVYDPFCPPLNPSSLNDEFDVEGSAIPAGWSSIGTLSAAVSQTTKGRLYLAAPANAGLSSVLLVKPLPAGPFTLAAHVINLEKVAYSKIALFVRSSVSARRMQISNVSYGSSIADKRVGAESYSANDTRDTIHGDSTWYNQACFLRITSDGTTLDFAVSEDGVFWISMLSQAITTFFTSGNVPNQLGLSLISENGSIGGKAAIDFIRYFPSATADIGRMVTRVAG